MPSNRAITAGRAVLQIVAVEEGVRKTLNEIEAQLEQTASRVRNIGIAITATGIAGLASFSVAIKEASRAQEIAAKFQEVFGGATEQMRAFFRAMADEVNRSEFDLQDFGAGFQDLLQPIGFDATSAREFSGELTQLAVDLASFNNRADAAVVRDLQAALTGSSETMKRYGVVVNETAVKQELLTRNIKAGEATEIDKVYARIAIIMRQTSAAQGDASRTAGSFANQMKGLTSAIRDTAVAVGGALLPIVTPIVSVLRFLTEQVRNAADAFPFLSRAAAAMAGVVTVVGGTITAMAAAVGLLLSPITLLTVAMRVLGISKAKSLLTTVKLIASYLTLSGAARAVGTAIGTIALAARALIATPIGAALTAAAIAISLFTGGVAVAGSEARAASADISAFARSIKDVEQAQQAVDVLKNLAEQSSLTASEQEQAQGLLQELASRYGELNIVFNDTTGKVVALETAFDDLSDKLRDDLTQATNNELKETTNNIELLERAIDKVLLSDASEETISKLVGKFREEIKKARAETLLLDKQLKALRGPDVTTAELSPEEKEKRDDFNIQQFRRLIDERIAGIDDERRRRIEAAREIARRDFAEAEKVHGDKRIIAERFAREVERINRDLDERIADKQKREAEENSRTLQRFALDRREAELQIALEGRDLELALLQEQEQEKIRLARERNLATLDIEREFAARRAKVNKQFDQDKKLQAERDQNRERSELLRQARVLQVQGTLATRVAGQQFSRGADDVARQQLDRLDRIHKELRGIRRKEGGIVAF